MFNVLPETERDAITVVVFIATFFAAVAIGRFLKRRAKVPLGFLFRLFCLTLAFYAAIAFYGADAPWRNHVDAAAILLLTALVVSLVNRYAADYSRKETLSGKTKNDCNNARAGQQSFQLCFGVVAIAQDKE